jgi:hypothetical protein
MGTDELDEVCRLISRSLQKGKVVPIIGAGVNLCNRPVNESWKRGHYLPSGTELARELATSRFPLLDGYDLARVSQYVAALEGQGSLYDELHNVFDADYPPTDLHHFLARLARKTRLEEGARECMLFVTTNYDDCAERAFRELDEPFDLVTYIAEGRHRGLFRHTPHEGQPVVITVPNEYADIRLDERTVIAKIHGAVDRQRGPDSYVITEDHYIDYITRADVSGLFPVTLDAKLRTSHFMFLGYSLRDWNVRVMLYRLWREQEGRTYKSWAVQDDPDRFDRAAWEERGVDIIQMKIDDFVRAIERKLSEAG